jgi:anthranilate synthase component 1
MAVKITKGTLTPIIETVDKPVDVIAYFKALAKDRANVLLFESKDIVPKYGEFSLGTHDPALKIQGRGEDFSVEALSGLGRKMIPEIARLLHYCDKLDVTSDRIAGRLAIRSRNSEGDELSRLKRRNHTDILRSIAFAYAPQEPPQFPYGGLFGVFSYDFIDQFEDLPANPRDVLNVPDYLFYYVDNLFVIDHKKNEMHIVANAVGVNEDYEELHEQCLAKIGEYKAAVPLARIGRQTEPRSVLTNIESDTTKEEYKALVEKMKEHILAGDVFQIVPSRTIVAKGDFNALGIYQSLRLLNPSPYMFYLDFGDHQLVGSSPEMAVRVSGKERKRAEIRPIAGTRPRGLVNGALDPDLDSRYETELKTNEKEIAEHIMLVDLARNDIAKIAVPGSRIVDEPLIVEKYSHVQHLVSNVSGILRPEFDALHVYLATMNMGTVCGAPKIEAMKILRRNEKTKRGYYGGAVGYLTPSGDFDSALVIRSLVIKDGGAYLRVGAGVVYDSQPEGEYAETEQKAQACLAALKGART